MTIILDGTNGITNDGAYTGDGVVFADGTPTNTLVTTTGGNVGVGTASPAYKLDVTGAGNSTSAHFYTPSGKSAIRVETAANDKAVTEYYTNGNGNWQTGPGITSAGNYEINSITASATRLKIDTSGYFFLPTMPTTGGGANCTISTGEGNKFYISTSALKYKQDIRDLESININKFRPVRYKSKCDGDDKNKDFFGFIADEIHDQGITELITYDADGEVNGFQYDRLTVVLVKAIQELNAKVDAQAAEIAELKAKP